eukprot:TRINITY_DN67868_c2_g1_i1.p1 TRINITY_DN67868_c2_g1~~TRINITY_DN67868_c2_g1_i1.p1  ORF type:complete len:118 (+),score=11.29 TRINITY_DN67868_c2_g1_i1:50-403(+)
MWTADREYLKCDVCGTYIKDDNFMDHRRACGRKGTTVGAQLSSTISTQLKTGFEDVETSGNIKSALKEDPNRRGKGTGGERYISGVNQVQGNNKQETEQETDDLLAMLDPDRFGKKG